MANLKVELSLHDGNLKKQINEDKKAVSEFGQTVSDSGKSVQEQAQNFQRAVGSITNYKKQLAQLTKEVISLEMSYSQLSDEQKKSDFGQALAQQLTEAKDKAAEFKDQIIDTQNEIKQLSSDSFKSDAFAQSVDVASTSLQSFVAITQLAGGDTEKLQSVIAKLILIQTTANGVIKITNALQAQSALMLGVRKAQEAMLTTAIAIRAAAEGKGTIATKAATVAQAAFNAVAKANPYVLLATATLAVGGALYAFCKASDKATEAEKERQKELEKSAEKQKNMSDKIGGAVGDVVGKYRVLQKEWATLKTAQEKTNWIKENQSAFDSLGLSVKSVSDAESVLVKMAPQVVAALKAVAEASAFEDLYKESITKKAKEWDRRTKSVETGDKYKPVTQGEKIQSSLSTPQEWINAGLTYGTDYTTSVIQNSLLQAYTLTKAGVDKVNKYRNDQAVKLNKELEAGYDEEISFYESRWDKARESAEAAKKAIPQTLLSGGGNTVKTDKKTPKVEVKPTFAEGSLADLENQLSTLQSKYKNGLITLTPSDYQSKVKELQTAIENKKIELGLVVPEAKINEQLQKLSEKNAAISRSQKYSSFDLAVGNNLPQGNRDLNYIQSQMNFNDTLLTQLQELANAYKELGDAGKEGLEKINSEIEKVTTNQTQLGVKAKQYTDENKRLEENAAKWQTVGDMVNNAGSAFSSLGSSFNIPALNVAGIIAQAIASVIQGYATASAQSATLGPWTWAAFSLAGIAQIASVIAQIHSLSGYAEGGIIKGVGSTVKDDTLIMAHTGEMVLNQSQQSRLFNLLNGTYSTNSNNSVGSGQVEFKIRGTELYGVLKNYSKVQSLIGKKTGIK